MRTPTCYILLGLAAAAPAFGAPGLWADYAADNGDVSSGLGTLVPTSILTKRAPKETMTRKAPPAKALKSSSPIATSASKGPSRPQCYGKNCPGSTATSSTSGAMSSASSAISGTSNNCPMPSASTYPSACTSRAIDGCIPCEGQPGKDPKTWCGLDINTDYYNQVPKTCMITECNLDIQNNTLAPDGVSRLVYTVNGQYPGPAITANWGDIVKVNVKNCLANNGTSIHFHGVRQLRSNEYDGVPGITQCPIAPGQSMTYTWLAEQYGNSWYHSHIGLQTWMGVAAPLQIIGPTSAPYDIDAGPILITDWTHVPVDVMYESVVRTGPPTQDNGLINGLNTFGAGGSRSQFTFTPGKSHLFSIVNTAIDSTFAFSIDRHTLTVISTDFVPIKPYTTNVLKINIGQRYQVIVKADQTPGDYWMRSDPQSDRGCGAANSNAKDIKAIVHYTGFCSTPSSTAWTYTSGCDDEPLEKLVPVLPINVGAQGLTTTEDVTIQADSQRVFRWYLSGNTFVASRTSPTLFEIYNTTSYAPNALALQAPHANEWVYVVIESRIPVPHPIHLHGHDFFILGKGLGTYSATTKLTTVNPPRRDVAMMPGAGYLVLGFLTDNPGAWLMHCHIGWHAVMGFELEIIERISEIPAMVASPATLSDTCLAWNAYSNATGSLTVGPGF